MVSVDKVKMREKYKLMRDSMHRADIMAKSLAVIDRLVGTDVYAQAEWLFPYVSYGSEVDTVSLIETALKHGKKVAVPIHIDPRRNRMVFCKIESVKDLSHGHYGILEPVYKEENVVEPNEKTLMIVPGVAFDLNGYRLGQGGGYYDRYLAEHKRLANYGLAYEQQIVDRIMINGYDVRMDGLVTENNVYRWSH